MGVRRFAGGGGSAVRPRRKPVLLLAAAVALIAGLWAGAHARQAARALDHHAAVLNGRIIGSAFLIGQDLALTNAHVVEGLRAGEVVTLVPATRGAPVRARLIAISPRMDLALLRAPAGFLSVVSAQDAPGRTGLAVQGTGIDASGGRGLGPRIELAGAVLDPRADLGAFGPGLVVRMPGVRPGFSGGPVIDGAGRLVGMITAIRSSAAPSRDPRRASGFAPVRQRPADEAFVLRAAAIRAEVRRLLAAAGE